MIIIEQIELTVMCVKFTRKYLHLQYLEKSITSFNHSSTECGGKNYHFVHSSADMETVVNGTIRSAFEYGGQKCSACSRMYVPQSKWAEVKEGLLERHKAIKMGQPQEADSFLSAVIDDKVSQKSYFFPPSQIRGRSLQIKKRFDYLETEYRLFPPVTIFLDLFPCAGYFFNASD